jgi:hypothetical protein
MIEQTESRTLPQPDWFEQTEEEWQKRTYWTCYGRDQKARTWLFRVLPESKFTLQIFYTKDEVECDSARIRRGWIWNGEPAEPILLRDAMYQARRYGNKAVACKAYRDGQWVKVKTWPCSVPLLGDL